MSDEEPDVVKRANLTHYLHNEDIFSRFLLELNDPTKPMSVTPRTAGPISASINGVAREGLDWFGDNKEENASEFYSRLCKAIGTEKADFFIAVIVSDWSDGMTERRNSSRMMGLRQSIDLYLQKLRPQHSRFQPQTPLQPTEPFLTSNDVSDILEINAQMLHSAIDDWIETRPSDILRSFIHVSRGLYLPKATDPKDLKLDFDFISSYTMAISVSEQFCQIKSEAHRAIVHTEIDSFANRTLFFSPFIPGMTHIQFELGIIPGRRPDILNYSGLYSGIHEYTLEPEPIA